MCLPVLLSARVVAVTTGGVQSANPGGGGRRAEELRDLAVLGECHVHLAADVPGCCPSGESCSFGALQGRGAASGLPAAAQHCLLLN
jgi:hypothetical protein